LRCSALRRRFPAECWIRSALPCPGSCWRVKGLLILKMGEDDAG
jgi:hypothetical protein